MGIKEDLWRFEQIGEDHRLDLTEYMQSYDMNPGNDTPTVPVTVIDLPEFVYAEQQEGGVGQGEGAEEGDPVEKPGEGEGDGDAGEGEGEHGYYEMDPEEFAEQLDEEFDLDLEPKGKKVVETSEGDFNDISRSGPDSTLDVDTLYKEGLKRTMAMRFDEDYLHEVMRVSGYGPQRVFEWARERNIPVSKQWVEIEYEDIDDRTRYDSIEEIPGELTQQPAVGAVDEVDIRRDDEQYRYPEIIEEKQKNVVVVNIRDVSGSMRENRRDLVERVFSPLDWYLQGKYDHAEFIYIAHDTDGWEVDREEFFGIQSAGGTKVSSAYEVAELLLENYPFKDWNRFVFGAGDGDNRRGDTEDNVVPLIEEIEANLHAYVEVDKSSPAKVGEPLGEAFKDDESVVTTTCENKDAVPDTVKEILQAASQGDSDD